ncbi:HNH endonuclease [Salinigranum halophilum]|uniref:HNH endonuclease n=1 Tax=Salinigranum halophilum TaxID=2565931 RepID=UPI0010A80AA4|nr:HNH endonuclease [Salinigranum halophilum]
MVKKNQVCEYCGEKYRGIGGLHSHQSAAHEDAISVEAMCTWCGDEMVLREWDADDRNYCSRACSKAWNRFLRQGKRHPNYKHGTTSRGREYDLIATIVHSRDAECRRCGALKCKNGRSLHVHHLTPEAQLDDPHEFSNLITVCDECHQTLERMPREQQLSECGIDSVETLELSDELRERYETVKQNIRERRRGPDPCLQMFAEAQKVLNERKAKSS